MAAAEGKNESSSNLASVPVERQEVEAGISILEPLVVEVNRRTSFSSEAGEPPNPEETDPSGEVAQQQDIEISTSSNQCQEEEDDWEALADSEPSLVVLSLSPPPENTVVSETPTVHELDPPTRRRGRGSFLYKTNELYSDKMDDLALVDHSSEVQDPGINSSHEESRTMRDQQYGTSHVLLLYDFPPTARTTHLERLFENFREGGFAIRWVSDTIALAVFRTPSAAHEAQTSLEFPFKVRGLVEGDIVQHKIPREDLEPPTVRPMTSTRTAQRMISHAIGMGLGSKVTSPRPGEFKMQEAARRGRLHQRHDMKDAAWGPD